MKLGGTMTGNVGAPASPTSTLTTCRTARCFTTGSLVVSITGAGGGGGGSAEDGVGVGGREGVDMGAVSVCMI